MLPGKQIDIRAQFFRAPPILMAKTKQSKATDLKAESEPKRAPKASTVAVTAPSNAKPRNTMPKTKNAQPDDAQNPDEVKPVVAKIAGGATFLRKQKEKLLALRDGMLDSMAGVAKDNLRSRAEGNEASAFGMHQADAGSDAYDRDFALSLLSQEQDALYEIEEALKRIEAGTYGICEISGKAIPHARLEAIPFARFTVECQSQIEKQRKASRVRQPVTSLFGLTDEEGGSTNEGEEEEAPSDLKE